MIKIIIVCMLNDYFDHVGFILHAFEIQDELFDFDCTQQFPYHYFYAHCVSWIDDKLAGQKRYFHRLARGLYYNIADIDVNTSN